MLLHNDANGEQAHNFKWGIKKGVGRTNKDLHFYKSFTYHGIEYSLYDCAYFHKIGAAETYIGKLVKIYETPGHEKKVKVVWFFHPCEIRNFLGDYEPRWNEVFLASGEGKGLSNINPLESIVQKCNVVCASHDKRNPQSTEQELRLADYIFYCSFDVGECKILKNFADRIDGIKVEHFFNKLKDQKVISQPILKPNVKVEGHAVRDGKSSSSCPVVKASEEVTATLGEQEGISNGNAILKPKTPINGPGPSKILCSQVDDKAKNVRSGDSSTWDASNSQPHKKRKLLQDEREDTISNKVGLQVAKDRGAKTVIKVKLARRPDADKRQWFKQLLKLKNITPTAAERRELKLDEFFCKGKGDAFIAEDGKSDDDDQDDFESPGPPKKVATSTSKQSEKSRFDGDGCGFKVEEMRKELKKVCYRQKKLSKDFSSIKCFLKKKFAEVFDTVYVLQSKLQTDRTRVGCKDFEVVDNDDKETEKDSDDEEDEDERNYGDDKEDDEEDNGGGDGAGGVGGDVYGEGDNSASKVDFDGDSDSCADGNDGVEKKEIVEKFDDFDCNLLAHIDHIVQAATLSKLVEESTASKPVLEEIVFSGR